MKILPLSEVPFLPDPRELTAEETAQAYALARAAFTAADLQRYTEPLEGIPFEEFLAELEAMQHAYEQSSQADVKPDIIIG